MEESNLPAPNQQPLDWREVLTFVKEQQKNDREHIKFLIWMAGGLLAVGTLVIWLIAWMGVQSYQSLVENLVRGYFREDRVQAVMEKAAHEAVGVKVRNEVEKMVRNEVEQQRPLIAKALHAETTRLVSEGLKPRVLSEEQRRKLHASASTTPISKTLVWICTDDAESRGFRSQIDGAAGWRGSVGTLPADQGPFYGLVVYGAGTADGKAVIAALNAAGIKFHIVQEEPSVCKGITVEVCLIVGFRE